MSDFPKHMLATKAEHKLGDLSREKGDLAFITHIDPDTGDYVGYWVTGVGFIDVKFDAGTTRELTVDEIKTYENRIIIEPGMYPQPIKIVGYDHIERDTAARKKPELDRGIQEKDVLVNGVVVDSEKVAWARKTVESHREVDAMGDDPNVYTEVDGESISAAAIVWAAEGKEPLVINNQLVSPETVERAWQAAAFGGAHTAFSFGDSDGGDESVKISATDLCRQALGTSPNFWDNLSH